MCAIQRTCTTRHKTNKYQRKAKKIIQKIISTCLIIQINYIFALQIEINIDMANHKSSLKRVRQDDKKRTKNRYYKKDNF